MRYIFTLFFAFIFLGSINAQKWFGDNAKWVYGYDDLNGGIEVTIQLYIDGTQIIDNVVTKVIKANQRTINHNISDTTFIESIYGFAVEGDVGAFAAYESDLITIYDFELNVAEILTLPLDNGTFVQLEVDQISDETINGVSLRYQNMRVITTCSEINDQIIRLYEGIGVVDELIEGYQGPLLHRMLDCFPEAPKLRLICYSDDNISYPEGVDCNIVFDEVTATSNINNQLAFNIYPNPAQQFIYINNEVNADIKHVELFNTTGTKLNNLQYSSSQVNVENITSGIYYLKVYFENGQVGMKRFVKAY